MNDCSRRVVAMGRGCNPRPMGPGRQFPALADEFPVPGKKIPCTPLENSLPRTSREFATSHWKNCVNLVETAESAQIPNNLPAKFPAEGNRTFRPVGTLSSAYHAASRVISIVPTPSTRSLPTPAAPLRTPAAEPRPHVLAHQSVP